MSIFGEGVCLVEWSDLVTELLPERYLHIQLETTGETHRTITLSSQGEPYSEWCRDLNEKWGSWNEQQ